MSVDAAYESQHLSEAVRKQAPEESPRSVSQPPHHDASLIFEPGEIYARLIGTLRDLLNCTGAALLLPADGTVVVPAQFGPHPLPAQINLSRVSTQILAHMARTQQPMALSRPAPFQLPLPAPARAEAWMGIPLLLEGRLHACLSAVGSFRPGDERIAHALTQQSAATLLWGLRHAAAQRHAQQIYQLLELEQLLLQTPDESAVELILDTAIASTDATHACLFVIQNNRTIPLARRGYSPDEATLLQEIPPSLQRGLHGRAYQTGVAARSDDIATDANALPALPNTRSQMVIPIHSAGQVFGLIDLQAPYTQAFQSTDDQWLRAIGALAALSIDRRSARIAAPQPGSAEAKPQHELLLSSRLAAVTDLAAGVAHEINNPLTTILGYTHLLLRDQSLPQTTRDDIGQIMIEGQRIGGLVTRFLRFAQPSSTGKLPVPVSEPLLEALSLLKGRLQESGVLLTVDIPVDSPMVLGQISQLEQVFLDLLQNALESMSTSDERRIAVQARQIGEWAQIAIADSGRGIMPDLLTRIFEPGFTTKVDKGISRGLGLGLYAARTIIQDHWGRIEVKSQLWQGSTFTVYLPAI